MDDMGEYYKHVYHTQRLATSEYHYDVKHMQRLYDGDDINTQFLHSMWCQPYEKNIIDEVLKRRVTNGSVVSLLDKTKHDELVEKTNQLVDVFYYGEKLTPFELDVERIYLTQKLNKKQQYYRRQTKRFKVRWTISDFNRY